VDHILRRYRYTQFQFQTCLYTNCYVRLYANCHVRLYTNSHVRTQTVMPYVRKLSCPSVRKLSCPSVRKLSCPSVHTLSCPYANCRVHPYANCHVRTQTVMSNKVTSKLTFTFPYPNKRTLAVTLITTVLPIPAECTLSQYKCQTADVHTQVCTALVTLQFIHCVRKVAVHLGYGPYIWLSVSKLPLQCAVVSLYSAVKPRLQCDTGKVCDCLIQFLITMVFQLTSNTFYMRTTAFQMHCAHAHSER
jgi:hypothetical protein